MGNHAATAPARRPLFIAIRRSLAVPFQDGFRRSRVHLPRAERREGPFQLSRNWLGNEMQDGTTGTRARPAHSRHAALGGRSAETMTGVTLTASIARDSIDNT